MRGSITRIDPDGSAVLVADGLDYPNGMVIAEDRSTLIVAESMGRRLTAYDVDEDGALHSRRVFADALDGFPDGIALDADGGVWVSMTLTHQFERIVKGGEVTDRVHIGERAAIACMLGGPDGQCSSWCPASRRIRNSWLAPGRPGSIWSPSTDPALDCPAAVNRSSQGSTMLDARPRDRRSGANDVFIGASHRESLRRTEVAGKRSSECTRRTTN